MAIIPEAVLEISAGMRNGSTCRRLNENKRKDLHNKKKGKKSRW